MFALKPVIVIVIVMQEHRDGEKTPDGGTPRGENLGAAKKPGHTHTSHLQPDDKG